MKSPIKVSCKSHEARAFVVPRSEPTGFLLGAGVFGLLIAVATVAALAVSVFAALGILSLLTGGGGGA